MEANIVLPLGIERVEQVTAKLAARGATQAMGAPGGADAVPATITSLADSVEPFAQRRRSAQSHLDAHHLFRTKRFVGEVGQIDITDFAHGQFDPSCASPVPPEDLHCLPAPA